MLLRLRPSGFIEPCLPLPAERPPSGPYWIHEIKHDGFRLMARRDPASVRLFTRNGNGLVTTLPSDLRGGEPAQGTVVSHRR
jgi:bifunctional non-homologous end joining protein LigD